MKAADSISVMIRTAPAGGLQRELLGLHLGAGSELSRYLRATVNKLPRIIPNWNGHSEGATRMIRITSDNASRARDAGTDPYSR